MNQWESTVWKRLEEKEERKKKKMNQDPLRHSPWILAGLPALYGVSAGRRGKGQEHSTLEKWTDSFLLFLSKPEEEVSNRGRKAWVQ